MNEHVIEKNELKFAVVGFGKQVGYVAVPARTWCTYGTTYGSVRL
jgi:hypothetical protein